MPRRAAGRQGPERGDAEPGRGSRRASQPDQRPRRGLPERFRGIRPLHRAVHGRIHPVGDVPVADRRGRAQRDLRQRHGHRRRVEPAAGVAGLGRHGLDQLPCGPAGSRLLGRAGPAQAGDRPLGPVRRVRPGIPGGVLLPGRDRGPGGRGDARGGRAGGAAEVPGRRDVGAGGRHVGRGDGGRRRAGAGPGVSGQQPGGLRGGRGARPERPDGLHLPVGVFVQHQRPVQRRLRLHARRVQPVAAVDGG